MVVCCAWLVLQLRGFFASGGNESPPPSESGGAMAAVGDAVSDVKAALQSAVAFFGTYCNRATLEELQVGLWLGCGTGRHRW